MTDALKIEPIQGFDQEVLIPGSKSLSNRALLLASLASGDSILRGMLFADDTERMMEAVQALGVKLEIDREQAIVKVKGCGGQFPNAQADLFLGNAGTATRFLTAACCLGTTTDQVGRYTIDGIPRMRERPIGELVDALRQCGAAIQYSIKDGYPPLKIMAEGLLGGEIELGTTLSSQYISALMFAAPFMTRGLTIRFTGPVTSLPYVRMSAAIMREFGATVEIGPDDKPDIHIPAWGYQARDYQIEPDASNASYFLAAAAILPDSHCVIPHLGQTSKQGDVRFARVLEEMGAEVEIREDRISLSSTGTLKGGSFNFNDIPDMAQTLAVVALFAEGPTAIRDVGNLRVKETDRMAALRNELLKLGALVMVDGDDLIIENPNPGSITPAEIETYDDHRMAMSFAVAGLAKPGVTILDPQCVNKTFPNFFDTLSTLGKSPI